MLLLVTHLTRMKHPRICVAGIDLDRDQHVRPVRGAFEPLTIDDTIERGGIFGLGVIVRLEGTRACGSPPEVEDHRYDPTTSALERVSTEDELWASLSAVAKDDLVEIFGHQLAERGTTYAAEPETGTASLGCLRVRRPLWLAVGRSRGQEHVRLAVRLGGKDRDLAVTDLRLFGSDFSAPDHQAVEDLNARLQSATEILLSVGLTRAMATSGAEIPQHWLQVNTLFCR